MAGLSAGLIASESAGCRVVIYEASPHAGGRCRGFYDKKLKTTIDNGNHLVMGANHAVLAYLGKLGTLQHCATTEAPVYPFIDLATRCHSHFKPPRFKGIPTKEWLHLLKLFRPAKHKTVTDCIPPNTELYRKLIEPFTLAALNTHPQEASALLLSGILRRLVTGGKSAWQTYIPAHGLSAAFVDPALTRIKGRGGSIRFQSSIQSLSHEAGRVTALHTTKDTITIADRDRVIIAVSPSALAGLLPELAPKLSYSPILNAHFLWPQSGMFRDQMPFLGVHNGLAQWIFFHDGRISTTTSAADGAMEKDEATLAAELWHDVCRALFMEDTRLPPCRIIKEKRATYTATPQNLAARPTTKTPYSNLFLAGDYLQCPYPATLEAAISSGFAAASMATGTLETD